MLSAAALMIGAIGFAQVTDDGVGGSGNTAAEASVIAPLSGAPGSANRGLTIQNGDDHKVRVQQVGTSQSAYTEQDNGLGTVGRNQADVVQTGNVPGGTSGEDNLMYVRQQGDRNESLTEQYGDDNNAHTVQGGDAGVLADRNKAAIRQGSAGAQRGQLNSAAIDQDGAQNQARTVQTYDRNDAWTIQVGELNKADIKQNAGPNNTAGHRALVTQNGNRNESHVDQSSDLGVRNSAETHQLGNRNKASQTQSNDVASPAGAGNDALINQGDEARRATSMTTSMMAAFDAVDNGNGASQGGSNGDGSERGIAIQEQDGSRNEAEIHQFGDIASGSNYAKQSQNMSATGERNDAYIVQNAFGNAAGGNNSALQTQEGSNNSVGLSQRGMGHKSEQFQDGDQNIAVSTQRGRDNRLNTNQWGNQNVVNTAQRGDNNKALVDQTDGQSYTVEQNIPAGLPAGGNQADIYQAGPGGGTDNTSLNFTPESGTPPFTNIAPLALPNI